MNRRDDGPRDECDQASDREEEMREYAIGEARRRASAADAKLWDMISAKWCEAAACGERIPDARRKAAPGTRYCAECQALIEAGRIRP